MDHFKILAFAAFMLLTVQNAVAEDTASVVLAGGCFWCVESDFDKLDGVVETVSGYAGGTLKNPTYETYNKTGDDIVPHIEVVKITYDPAQISYDALLDYYFRHIDPTDGKGQFCDRGPGYRPAIFVAHDREDKTARDKIKAVEQILEQDVNVDILPAARFWPAEEYHQDYYTKHPLKYRYYRFSCGRDRKIKQLWSDHEG
ncbi:MAG: peptide-methionine (S)-S-oxide reductase MsrA, partial [Pseudomonadota bacterium]